MSLRWRLRAAVAPRAPLRAPLERQLRHRNQVVLGVEHAVVLVVAAGGLVAHGHTAGPHLGARQLDLHLLHQPLRRAPVAHALPPRVVPPERADRVRGAVEHAVGCRHRTENKSQSIASDKSITERKY